MVRVDGGFVILNYMKYRDRDYTAAKRQKALRERRKQQESRRDVTLLDRDITHSREQIADIKSNPPIPPLTVRDRRRLNEEIWRLMEKNAAMPIEEAMETACAELLLPLAAAKRAMAESGMSDALKRQA